MSDHPPLLDTAEFFAQHAGADIADAFDKLNEAAERCEGVDKWLESSVEAVTTTNGLIEKHIGAYAMANDFAGQATQLHQAQHYGPNNGPARRATILLRRGVEEIDAEKEALLAMGTALGGAKERLEAVRSNVATARGYLETSIEACAVLGFAQLQVIEGIQRYIAARDTETAIVRNVQGMVEIADENATKVAHNKEPKQVSEQINEAKAALAGQEQTLAAVEAAIADIPGIMQEIDRALSYWVGGMRSEIPGLYTELVRLTGQLQSPLTAEVLKDYTRRLEYQRKSFEAAQTALDETKGFVTSGKQFFSKAISAIIRYLQRGY